MLQLWTLPLCLCGEIVERGHDLVADRFVVTTTTRGLGEDSAKKIAERIGLRDLAGKAP